MSPEALLQKLQHRAGTPALVLWAPAEVEPSIGAWEDAGVAVHRRMRGGAPFVLAFVRSRGEIERSAARLASLLGGDDPLLWMAYPKRSSKAHRSDVGRDDSWQPLGDLGFEPVRQVAIDADWSALRFRRTEKVAKLNRTRALSPAGRDRLAAVKAPDDPAVDEWLAGLAEPRRTTLTTVHRLIREAAPALAPSLEGPSIGYRSRGDGATRLVLRANARTGRVEAVDGRTVRFRKVDDLDLAALRGLVRAAVTTL